MQRYFSSKNDNNYLYLTDNDLYHIKTVMRMKNGDCVEIVYNNELFIATIENIENNPQFKIVEQKNVEINNIPYVSLIIPYLQESKIDLILQKGTEMGVNEFIFCPMARCVVKMDEKKLSNKISRWMKICKEASEQSKRIDIPKISTVNKINDLQSLPGLCLTCSTHEKDNYIKKVLKSAKKYDRINLVIGPEGGLSEAEEQELEKIGYKNISLGNLIMRVESVPLFLISVINYEYME